ncbi:MAG: S9 family peptidase [Ignavibacteriales bacterium]|nr:S9 family peptidase [Ignavibacteriales bacterium]
MKHTILFLFFLFLFGNQISYTQQRTKEYTIEDIFSSPSFQGKSIRGMQWIENGKAYSFLETDTSTKRTNVMRYDVESGKKTVLIDGMKLKLANDTSAFNIQNYFWSKDEQQIIFTGTLVARAVKSGGNFYLYTIKSGEFIQVTNTMEEQVNIQFSPNSKMIGFVRANNIFVYDIATKTETQLTFDGAEHIINGHFDWVYEEEFSIINGWEFSPDGKYIAYWQLDENRVPEFPINDFLPTHQNVSQMRYPKAGDKNSIVKIGVVEIATKQNKWLDFGEPMDSTQDTYISRMQWTGKPNELSFQKLNRLQNKLELYFADVTTGKSKIVLTEESKTWVESENSNPHFLKNGNGFLWTSERDGYNHIYFYDMNGKLIRQLTKGKWDVASVSAVDEKNELVYFTAGNPTPMEKQLFSVELDGSEPKRISESKGNHGINFSPDRKYFVDSYSDANTPTKIALRKSNGKLVRMIEENPLKAFDEYPYSQKEFFTFKTSDGVELNGWMIKPHNFDAAKKYPVFMNVYGGPGSQTVTDAWGGRDVWWYQMLAQKGYMIVSVDNRGTGFRGKDFKSITYKNLGKWEANDQVEAAKYLGTLPYVDKSRIGIWGWSYGGYMTLMALEAGQDVFKAGISVAPVTHWKFYDTIYTERFMQTPQLNPDGYKESAPSEHAEKIKSNLLLVHGTGDDNVHWQNSVTMADAMIKNNVQFQTMFYPNRMHGIGDKAARLHLYTMFTKFLMEKL